MDILLRDLGLPVFKVIFYELILKNYNQRLSKDNWLFSCKVNWDFEEYTKKVWGKKGFFFFFLAVSRRVFLADRTVGLMARTWVRKWIFAALQKARQHQVSNWKLLHVTVVPTPWTPHALNHSTQILFSCRHVIKEHIKYWLGYQTAGGQRDGSKQSSVLNIAKTGRYKEKEMKLTLTEFV